MASKLWYKLCKEANFLWVIPGSCDSLLMENPFAFVRGTKAKTLWKCAVAALCWVIWEERNVRIFKGKSVDNVEEMWDRVCFLTSLWASVSKDFHD